MAGEDGELALGARGDDLVYLLLGVDDPLGGNDVNV
jgi:hypothetical protein